ncbi:MAG: asparagine synthase C-terminal domain-containing protein, partial [Burkholderiaceae bacterium]|nr:asparagine synthase C-terminal domain-containing protein [Burkholderiaceae bacterium]
MCSGGLDSSLVTAFARDTKPDLVSYVADIDGARGEELRRAQAVCSALSVELRPVKVDTGAYFGLLPRAILANDQPPFFPQSIAGLLVARALRDDGFKVMLTGDGADELFGGYSWHADEYRTWRRRRLHARWIRDNPLTRMLGRFSSLLQPLDLERLSHNPFAPVFDRHDSVNVALIDGARRRTREARLFRKLDALPLHEDRAYLARGFEDIYVHMREYLGSMDRMAMFSSVEGRVPFLENELIDFGLHLPPGAKFHRGVTKRLIKGLAEKRLPREIVHLPKIGFSVHWDMWKGTTGVLREGRLAELLKWRRDDQEDIVRLLAQRPYYQFALVSTELWLRMRFGGESPDDLSDKLHWMKGQA